MKNYCVVIVLLVFADVTWYSTNTSTTADVRNRDNGNIIQDMFAVKKQKNSLLCSLKLDLRCNNRTSPNFVIACNEKRNLIFNVYSPLSVPMSRTIELSKYSLRKSVKRPVDQPRKITVGSVGTEYVAGSVISNKPLKTLTVKSAEVSKVDARTPSMVLAGHLGRMIFSIADFIHRVVWSSEAKIAEFPSTSRILMLDTISESNSCTLKAPSSSVEYDFRPFTFLHKTTVDLVSPTLLKITTLTADHVSNRFGPVNVKELDLRGSMSCNLRLSPDLGK